jgi:hypothetical protein
VVGFEKFYIYLHKCKDRTGEQFESLKRNLDITIHKVPDDLKDAQIAAYNHAYAEYNHEVDWMAFIDRDEFLYPSQGGQLQESLKQFHYKKISGLGIYWVCFGSSGHIEEPDGLIIKNFRHRGPLNMAANSHIKSVLMGRLGDRVKSMGNPHIFRTPIGIVDEKMRPIFGGRTNYEPSHSIFRINHYITQSRNFYLNVKQNAGLDLNKNFVRPESWWVEHDRNDMLDSQIDCYIKPTEDLLRKLS